MQKCHQRILRERLAEENPRPVVPLDGCSVGRIDLRRAKQIILRYEWLGTVGKPIACYGLMLPDGELAGAVCLGAGPHTARRHIIGSDAESVVACLERGACAHWAHPHAASFLISRAVRLASREHGWEVFYAYSDPAAGEIGTVYQACSWLYLGRGANGNGSPRQKRVMWRRPGVEEGDFARYVSTRVLRHRSPPWGFKDAEAAGWVKELVPTRHLYATAIRPKWRRALVERWGSQPYPKRQEES